MTAPAGASGSPALWGRAVRTDGTIISATIFSSDLAKYSASACASAVDELNDLRGQGNADRAA
jgi:hypothetical protein